MVKVMKSVIRYSHSDNGVFYVWPETTMYPRCWSRVLCHHSNVVRNRMTIKLVDEYSMNHVEGHE